MRPESCSTSSGHGSDTETCVITFYPADAAIYTITASYPGDSSDAPSKATAKLNVHG